MSPVAHVFDQAIALESVGDGVFHGHTHPDYANMVGPFGGITAAQMLQAVWLHPERLGEPAALTVNFCAAVADGAFTIHTQAARTNRSTQHWIVTLRQDDAIVASATVVTALRRPTLRAQDAGMPDVPPPDQVTPMPGESPVAWIERYDIRYVQGGLPQAWDGSDAGHSQSCGWFADQPARGLDFASVAALCDVFFPRVWLRRAKRVAIGTVTMTVYFHASAQELAQNPGRFVLGQAQGHVMHDGFADQTGTLWSEAGRCLATTHQNLYYKE